MPGTQAEIEPAWVDLQPVELWFRPTAGPLLPQVRAALAAEARRLGGGFGCGDGREPVSAAARSAEPLRWAITAVDTERGLRLEGVMVLSSSLPAGPLPAAGG